MTRWKTHSTRWLTLAALGMTLAAMLLATGCERTTAGAATSVACGAFEPIRWSTRDTDETIRQVKQHNAAGAAIKCW